MDREGVLSYSSSGQKGLKCALYCTTALGDEWGPDVNCAGQQRCNSSCTAKDKDKALCADTASGVCPLWEKSTPGCQTHLNQTLWMSTCACPTTTPTVVTDLTSDLHRAEPPAAALPACRSPRGSGKGVLPSFKVLWQHLLMLQIPKT